jgi:hypothetical protein
MKAIMELAHRKNPTMGARKLRRVLPRNGHEDTRWTTGPDRGASRTPGWGCRKPRTTAAAAA